MSQEAPIPPALSCEAAQPNHGHPIVRANRTFLTPPPLLVYEILTSPFPLVRTLFLNGPIVIDHLIWRYVVKIYKNMVFQNLN